MSVPMPTASSARAVAGNLSEEDRDRLRAFCRRQVEGGGRTRGGAHRQHQRSGEQPQVSYQTFLNYFQDAKGSEEQPAVTPLPVAGSPRRVRRATSSAPASFGFRREGVEFAAEWDGTEWQVTIRAGMPNDMMLRYAGLLQRDFFDL